MAAVLESVLSAKVDIKTVVGWLKNVQENDQQGFGEFGIMFHKQEFVPFLLNFLRDQSSHALTHGPATPAKTPNRPRPPALTQDLSDRKGCRSTGGSRGASRVQLFSPATSVSPRPEWEADAPSGAHSVSGVSAFSSPSFSTTWSPANRPSSQRLSLGDFIASPPELQQSPTLHPQKGRRKGGRGGHSDETLHGDTGGKRSVKSGGGYGRINECPPPSSNIQINLNNMDDFPPIGSSPVTPVAVKPSRRINPTPVSAERPHSKPKSCFTSTPFSKKSSSPSGDEANDGSVMVMSSLSLQEERELLKQEKTKRAQQVASPPISSVEPSTPTKSGMAVGSKVSAEGQMTCPEPSKVIFSSELDLLAEIYCTCISENLVPNIFLELFFVMQLLTSWSPHNHEDGQKALCVVHSDFLERCYLRRVHNCVYFAVKVLENQFQLVSQLDKCTLRMLAENERVATFSPNLRDRLVHAQDRSTAKLSPSVSTFIHSVPFQPATDNRSNFGNDKAFHTFKKQRDVFYELLREWEDFHKEPGWTFDYALGSRIRGMMGHLTSAGNHSHFARLFLKQLVQMCKGPRVSGSLGDAPDADLLGMLGADSLGRLKRLEERLIQPHTVVGPCPPPAFPGHQEFFRDFLQTASCCQLNQHLQDSLCQQLLQLDEVSILSPPTPIGEGEEEEDDGDMEQQDEKQRFSSVLLHARLLAKFLGFICFLPYQTSERASREIQETAVTMRSKSIPVLDVCAVLTNSIQRRRTILTVPWMVEFLSMMDFVGPLLLSYRTALGTLLLFYRRMHLVRCEEMCYLNKLLLVSVLGWLFQIPAIPEDIFYTSAFTDVAKVEDSNTSATGLDCIPLVDQQLLYTCCPFLGEFRKLLAAFVSGSTAKSGGIIRKITPTSAELKDSGTVNRSQQKLQVDLEQAFFHNQPPSLRRTVEFVAERVGSNAVKHMKATLVSELVVKGEKMLKDGLNTPNANASKLNETICAQLCEAGLEALGKATRFCCEKSPEAIRTLLPEESSPTVLTTAENITKRLAAEKACSWLSANITALVRREWKSRFDRVMKAIVCPAAPELSDADRVGLDLMTQEQPTTPKRIQTSTTERSMSSISCPAHCPHQAPRPSDVLVQLKELLSIAVGPRSDEELPTFPQLTALLHRVGVTLACRKFLTVVSEQMLLNSTVLLACKLVSAELPVSECGGPDEPAREGDSGWDSVRALLEQLVELWERTSCSSAPLHQLFSPLTISAVLRSGNPERRNYLYLVRKLVDRGLLREDEVISHWEKLTDRTLPVELIENFQLQVQSKDSSLALAEVQSHFDTLQVSHQTVDGTT